MIANPESENQPDEDIRPLVASKRNSRAVLIFAVALVGGGFVLFQTLDARRATFTAPSVLAPLDAGRAPISSPPELSIPPQPDNLPWRPDIERSAPSISPAPSDAFAEPATAPAPSRRAGATYLPPAMFQQVSPGYRDDPSTTAGDAVGGGQGAAEPQPIRSTRSGGTSAEGRVYASHFDNPATTVPKGTVVHAILESALDSTRGGFARAIISRDVHGFDGSQILIPRGSRILGEYKSDVTLGQSRILIQWQRLLRPDGVMINIDSPSADPLGRAGVEGKVNTHFLERFGGSILQSTLDIGVQIAARAASPNAVVVALPGSLQQGAQVVQLERIQPTIKVRQGSSVSVFVAKDLDFTGMNE